MAQTIADRQLPLAKIDLKKVVGSGAVAGIIGGVLMAMLAMAYSAAKGMGLLMPLRLIGATVFGQEALAGGPSVLLVGLMIHMMASIAWGIAFAALIPRTWRAENAIPVGIIYGVFVWAIMTFVALPMVNPLMRENVSAMPVAWFIEHVLFGLGVGLAPVISRRWATATAAHSPR